MSQCLFCRIIAGDLPSQTVFDDDKVVVIKDIHPRAPVHLLVMPRHHLVSLNDIEAGHDDLITHMIRLLPDLARGQGLTDGFRTIINTGPGGGQEVPHLHIHLLGGESLPGF